MKRINKKNKHGLVLVMVFFCLAGFFGQKVQAQFVGGFFNQQSDKQKLMLVQIAGYQAYLNAIKTGYYISGKGLFAVNTQKTGSFTLNSNYFDSLRQVSGAVQNDPRVKLIMSTYQQIVAAFTTEIAWQQQQKILTSAELGYVRSVFENLVQRCRLDLNEMSEILAPGKLQMTDAQRLNKLDQINTAMQDKQAFASAFISKCRKLALSRKQAASNRGTLKSLYGIR